MNHSCTNSIHSNSILQNLHYKYMQNIKHAFINFKQTDRDIYGFVSIFTHLKIL